MSIDIRDILEVIGGKYRSVDAPNFSFVQKAIDERPYQKLIEALKPPFAVEEITDPNDDVSFGYVLSDSAREWILRLSMIGPYAVLLRMLDDTHLQVCEPDSPKSNQEVAVLELLAQSKVQPLGLAILEFPVHLKLENTDMANVRVFQALFSDSDYLPWEDELDELADT